MPGMPRSLIPCLLAVLAFACVPKTGRLESNRFQHERYPYAVFFPEPVDPAAPFGKSWRIDNLTESTREPAVKSGAAYTLNRVYDLNQDGRGDFERLEQRYDLLLEHTSDNAAMWVATFPLAERAVPGPDGETSALAVLAGRYAKAMATQGELAPEFGPESSEAPAAGAQASVERIRACSLSEREAVRADVAFAKQGEQRSASIVLVRTGYTDKVTDGVGAGRYPVFMILGVLARTEQRAALEGEFQRLLDHTVLGDQGMGLSMHGVNTCGSQAPEPPNTGAEVPAAAVPGADNPESQLQQMPPEEAPASP
jgi:hypothetical protein